MPIAAAASNALKLKGTKKGGDGCKVKLMSESHENVVRINVYKIFVYILSNSNVNILAMGS